MSADSSRPEFTWRDAPWKATQHITLQPVHTDPLEIEIRTGRIEAARRFADVNEIDRLVVDPPDASLLIVTPGRVYYELRDALSRLGLTERDLATKGVRVYKPAQVWPLAPGRLEHALRGVTTVVVIEEKRAFLETQIKDLLYHRTERPDVLGKRDRDGAPLVPDHGIVDVDLVARTLVRVLGDRFDGLVFEPARRLIPLTIVEDEERRKPFFCSGCPHGRSTQVPDGAVGGAGIGCHVLSPDWTVMSTQMGGEGVAWVGAHAFMVDPPHLFQNVGDGTFAHSASLAVRQAVGFGTTMTFKILLNGTVAMTGGQAVAGGMDAPKLTRVLQAEGVSRIIVCADDPDKYGSDALWAPGTTVWGRARLDEAEHELMATEGVSILIFDQACATELRRQRKRGEVAVPKERVFINERVCEGCGDCVQVSYCLSLQPVETEFGRKTRIHQESCNIDRSCLEGDCPSFVTITPGTPRPIDHPDESRGPLPDPVIPERADLLFVGIGGTGVTTVSQVLGTAALLDGKASVGLDQTGMSQKAGPVVSHVRIGPADSVSGNRLGEGEADAVLAFDVLGAVTPANLARMSPDRTTAIVSVTRTPTGAMILDPDLAFPEVDRLVERIAAQTADHVVIDAEAATREVFGTGVVTNMVTLGTAFQAGVIPLSAAAIDGAIDLNGVAVDMNRGAFELGRWLFLDAELRRRFTTPLHPRPDAELSRRLTKLVPDGLPDDVAALIRHRAADLVGYQDEALARRYLEFVGRVSDVDRGDARLTRAVAGGLYKVMAVKDEYEVARLHRDPQFWTDIEAQFGDGAAVTFHLSPPALRRFRGKRKIRLGKGARPMFALLARLKRLRGTWLDPFGRSAHRRMERGLVDEYRATIETVLVALAEQPDGDRAEVVYEVAVEIAGAVDMIRGYEAVKERNVERYRARVGELLTQLSTC